MVSHKKIRVHATKRIEAKALQRDPKHLILMLVLCTLSRFAGNVSTNHKWNSRNPLGKHTWLLVHVHGHHRCCNGWNAMAQSILPSSHPMIFSLNPPSMFALKLCLAFPWSLASRKLYSFVRKDSWSSWYDLASLVFIYTHTQGPIKTLISSPLCVSWCVFICDCLQVTGNLIFFWFVGNLRIKIPVGFQRFPLLLLFS